MRNLFLGSWGKRGRGGMVGILKQHLGKKYIFFFFFPPRARGKPPFSDTKHLRKYNHYPLFRYSFHPIPQPFTLILSRYPSFRQAPPPPRTKTPQPGKTPPFSFFWSRIFPVFFCGKGEQRGFTDFDPSPAPIPMSFFPIPLSFFGATPAPFLTKFRNRGKKK